MGYYCTVPQCTSLAGKTKNVKFHRFPRDEILADKWNVILKRGKPYTKYSKVCSLHFTQADYNVTTMGQWKTLSKDAVPSQNLPKLNPDGTVMVIRKSRTVKYREGKKDDISEKQDKWALSLTNHSHSLVPSTPDSHMNCDPQDSLAYRYPINNLNLTQQLHNTLPVKPKKQDAIMQTDPVQSEEDDSQPNNNYHEVAQKYNTDITEYPPAADFDKKYEAKNYSNKDDFLRSNDEYNNEADKYALARKSVNGYDKQMTDFQKNPENYQKTPENYQKNVESYQKSFENYQKISDMFPFNEKSYLRNDYYQYHDSVEQLRSQQQNLQILHENTRLSENQNFFNENHIKQEINIDVEDETFLYERNKDPLDADMYNSRRILDQQRLIESLQHPVKQEPDVVNGGDNVMQPQGSPFYQSNTHNNVTGGYYEPRPGPELLIAKQNALAAHTQLWQNTMKRPFFYSETSHYNAPPLLHRYEDITRILQ